MIRDGQNIFDAALQNYGTIEQIFDLIDNNSLTLNSDLNSGMELNYDLSLGNNVIKKYIKDNNISPNNYGSSFDFFNIYIENYKNTDIDDSIKEGQSIFDITLQYFGTLEKIFDLLDSNNLNINSYLNSSQKLNISNFRKGNEEIKDYIKAGNYSINNDIQYPSTGSQLDILLQWPEFVDPEIIINGDLIIL